MFGSQCGWIVLQHHFHSVCVILYAHIIRTLQQVPHNSTNKTHCCFFFVQLLFFFFSHFSLLTFKFLIRILACSYIWLWSGWHQLISNATARSTYYNFGAQTPNIPISYSGFDGARFTSKLVYFNVATITVDSFSWHAKFPLSILQMFYSVQFDGFTSFGFFFLRVRLDVL